MPEANKIIARGTRAMATIHHCSHLASNKTLRLWQ